jgi:hypothetical protein
VGGRASCAKTAGAHGRALLHALFAWNEFAFALVFISTGDLKK